MKNKLGALMIVAILAMTFSCGSKKTEESATTTDTTATVKADTTVKAAVDTTKAK
jgi:hypothetical protein